MIYTDNDPPDEWTFARDGERIVQRVSGSVKANNGDLLRALAVAGQGIIFQPAFIVGTEIAMGKLVPILARISHTRHETALCGGKFVTVC